MPRAVPIEVRFWKYVTFEPNTGCWLWVGGWCRYGYGKFNSSRNVNYSRTRKAHRTAYELHKGPIADGLTIDHLCRTRCCVNPDHLEPVTDAVNKRRGLIARGLALFPEIQDPVARKKAYNKYDYARRRAKLSKPLRPQPPYQHLPGKRDRREYWREYRALHGDRMRERERQRDARRRAERAMAAENMRGN